MLHFSNGDYLHIYNRGVHKQNIFFDEYDYYHALQALFYLNDGCKIETPFRKLKELYGPKYYSIFKRPDDWPEQERLVDILALILMPNHYHLLVRVIKEEDVPLFMKKFSNSITGRFNKKYDQSGSLFQGRYKAKLIEKDSILNYVSTYIHIKNGFELLEGDMQESLADFDTSYAKASENIFSSLSHYAGVKKSPIISAGSALDFTPEEYKSLARDYGEGLLEYGVGEDFKKYSFEE